MNAFHVDNGMAFLSVTIFEDTYRLVWHFYLREQNKSGSFEGEDGEWHSLYHFSFPVSYSHLNLFSLGLLVVSVFSLLLVCFWLTLLSFSLFSIVFSCNAWGFSASSSLTHFISFYCVMSLSLSLSLLTLAHDSILFNLSLSFLLKREWKLPASCLSALSLILFFILCLTLALQWHANLCLSCLIVYLAVFSVLSVLLSLYSLLLFIVCCLRLSPTLLLFWQNVCLLV